MMQTGSKPCIYIFSQSKYQIARPAWLSDSYLFSSHTFTLICIIKFLIPLKNLSSTNSRTNSSNWSQIQVLLKQYNSQNTIHQTWIKIYISLNNILLLSNGHSHQHIFLWNPWIDSQDWYFSEKITKVYSGWLNEFLNISSKEFFRIKIC